MKKEQKLPLNKEFFSISLKLYKKADFLYEIEEFFGDDKLNTIIMVTTDMIADRLLSGEKDTSVPEDFVLLPGERALFTKEEINCLGGNIVTDFTCLDSFFTEGACTVYIVGDNEKRMRLLMKCFQELNSELTVQGAYYVNPFLSEELKLSDELIVNEINGNDPDILVVMMDSPRQEEWIKENKSILHAKVCIGMGAVGDSFVRIHKKPTGIFKAFHLNALYKTLFCRKNKGERRKRRIFYKKLEQYKNKKEL